MNIYKEVKEIAKCNAKIKRFTKLLEDKIVMYGLDWGTAELVTLSKEQQRHFEQNNGVTEDYFVEQWTGYSEDDFYGYMFFKTDVNGQYVKVFFEM